MAATGGTPLTEVHPARRRPRTRRMSNLPAQVSSFIGRQAELAAVRDLVAGPRLVTLTGAGGAGKPRLGLRVTAAPAASTMQ